MAKLTKKGCQIIIECDTDMEVDEYFKRIEEIADRLESYIE